MTATHGDRQSFPTRFRRRLALFCAGAVAVSTAAFGAGSFLFIRNDTLDRFEANALRETAMVLRMAGERDGEPADVLASRLAERGRAGVVIVGDDAASTSEAIGPDDVPKALTGRSGAGLRAAVADADGRSYLVVGGAIPDRDAEGYLFFDRRKLSHEVSMVGRSLAVAWLIVFAVASVVSDRLARRALWPVRRAADAANDLAAGLLQTRLPVEGDDEFAAWASSFNRMVDELERRIAREQRFTADVAHELRTPLGSLLTAATMLEAQHEKLPEQARRPAELIVQEVRRQRALVDDLLEISRLESGRDAVVAADVELRERIRDLLAHRGWNDRVRLEGSHVRVVTDARRVDRVIANLVDNALRHGKEPVVVSLRRAEDAIVIEVQDHGEPIPADELGELFEAFFKRDASRPGPGSGLGLAIAAQHARTLGGRLLVESRPGAGMCFALALPVSPPAPPGKNPEEER